MEPEQSRSQERLRAIAARLEDTLGEPLAGGPTRLSSGASRETFAFELASRGRLVVQIDRHRDKLNEAPAQAPLLAAALEAGVPVPVVIAHGEEDPVLGSSWAVVEALAGTADPREILDGRHKPDALKLLDDIAGALVAVHRMPADPALARPIEDPLGVLREWHDRLSEPHPTFELAFRALGSEAPARGRRSLVHGDFRMGNLMVDEHGLTGVLDWELTHLGDPVEDLGWLCVPAWRFSHPDCPAAGLGTRRQLISAYERHGGVAVEEQTLRWWELEGTLRWGVICVMQAFAHLSGAINSIEHAVIGRRAAEVEWDLLELLDPSPRVDGSRSEDPAPVPDVLHDRPTTLELLDAARSTLGDDVLPRLDGRAAFQTRVTMRALGMVRRELALADEHRAVRARVLDALGVGGEAELARAIRAGDFEGRDGDVFAALRAIVRSKLEVANPKYVTQSQRQTATEGEGR